MTLKKTGTVYDIEIGGAIGEAAKIFETEMRDATRITLNLDQVTYINSIGVKNWIQWVGRLPQSTELILKNTPLVIVNQASTVRGFINSNSVIESFYAPMVCPKCNNENKVLLRLNDNYKYATKEEPRQVVLPTTTCGKCSTPMEADFIEEKTCSFLDLKP